MMASENQPLIKGVFNTADAKEIIRALFESKKKFHSYAAFGIEERTGRKAVEHIERMRELTESMEKLLQCIDHHANKNSMIRINCLVKMEIEN